MSRNEEDKALEARLRAALRDEAGELWPPPTLWPRVQAALVRPVDGAPHLMRPPAELQGLLRRGDLHRLALALLAEREMDAFTLARRVEGVARGAGRAARPEGSLLPVLHRLEIERLLDTRWLPGPRGLRRVYTLSVRGRRVRQRARWTWRLAGLRSRLGGLIPRHLPITPQERR